MQAKDQSQDKSQVGTAPERSSFSHVSLYMICVWEVHWMQKLSEVRNESHAHICGVYSFLYCCFVFHMFSKGSVSVSSLRNMPSTCTTAWPPQLQPRCSNKPIRSHKNLKETSTSTCNTQNWLCSHNEHYARHNILLNMTFVYCIVGIQVTPIN